MVKYVTRAKAKILPLLWILMSNRIIIFLISILGLAACNEGVLVNEFHKLNTDGWNYEEVVSDTFNVSKTHHYHQIFANLRITSDYNYSNIHLKISLTYPDSTQTERVIPITLSDKKGKWTGSGMGNILTYQVPIMGKLEFKEKGKYTIAVEQYMRIENLPHVVSVGIKVEQLEEIF
jgi:gliding motility-associated lipoprotein GldH